MEQGLFPELQVLVVDDEQEFLKSLSFVLKTNGIANVECCQDSREVMPRLKKKKFCVILLDLLMPLYISGEELLLEIVEQFPEIPVIIVTAHADIETAKNCMKKGALDYLMKPFETKDVLKKINDALYLKDLNKEIILLKKDLFSDGLPKPTTFPDITSRSEKMQPIFQMIGLIAVTSMPILIQGELGVGKKFIAREIHKQSRRKGKFIEFNTAGVDDNSFDDMVLGHKKGPLDKVGKDTKGLLEEARDGTLFFNEISNLTLQSQVKLYHLIKDWEYLPPGSDKPVSTNVRIIAETEKNLPILIKTNDFRHELYSLLKANDINIPPLREHKEDIPLLFDYFVNQAAEESGIKRPSISEKVYIILEQYNFPGNIGELKKMVYEAIIKHKSGNLTAAVFEEKIKNRPHFSSTGIELPANKKVFFEKNLPSFAEEEVYPESPILIVDDEPEFLKSINFCLRSEGITNFECCQDSRDVLPRLEKKKYSLILLDLIMPHIRGEELLPRIIKKYPEIPIIAVTAVNEINTILECKKHGAVDYLVKPVDRVRLIITINHYLDKTDIEKKKLHFPESLMEEIKKNPDAIKEVITVIRELIKNDQNIKNIDFFYTFDENLKRDFLKLYHKERYHKYEFEKVGEGGIGTVHKAKDTILERVVALKTLTNRPNLKKRDIDRFISEAKKVAKLHHINIVSVYDCGQIDNDYFIAMEFVEGKDLGTIIRDKHPIPIPDILVIAKKLFTALEHSHQNGVIHRDIKPGNIMITYANEVKVVDFGIALLRDDLKSENRNVIYGTPFYMSPEQIENSTIDHISDIYSAGVTLFHLVTGSVPFKGSREEIKRQHLDELVPSIKGYRNDAPEKLIKIIEKCMAKRKEDRYQSARKVIKEIYGIQDENGNALITDQTKLRIFHQLDDTTQILETDTTN